MTPGATSVAGEAAARAAAWTSLCWRTSNDRPWKPNVSSCQRRSRSSPSTTRLQLQIQQAPCDLVQLAAKAGDVGISARVPCSCAPQPLGDVGEPAAERLFGEAGLEVARCFRKLPHVRRQSLGERSAGLCADCDGQRQPTAHRLVGTKDVVALDFERFTGHGRRDGRIAVPVATHPGSPADERGNDREIVASVANARPTLRYSRGATTNSDSSNSAITLRTSSNGPGRPREPAPRATGSRSARAAVGGSRRPRRA